MPGCCILYSDARGPAWALIVHHAAGCTWYAPVFSSILPLSDTHQQLATLYPDNARLLLLWCRGCGYVAGADSTCQLRSTDMHSLAEVKSETKTHSITNTYTLSFKVKVCLCVVGWGGGQGGGGEEVCELESVCARGWACTFACRHTCMHAVRKLRSFFIGR